MKTSNLKGLFCFFLMLLPLQLLAEDEEPASPSFTVNQYIVDGSNPLGEELTQQALSDYLGVHQGMDGLLAATDELESALKKAGFTFHRVLLPPQTLKGGVIHFKIVEFSVGEIRVEQNKLFDDDNIKRSLPQLVTGQAPNTLWASRALLLANSHPSKKIRLLFADSEKQNAIDARIIVDEKSPHIAFLSFNNTGNTPTGETRLTGGYSYSNLLNKDITTSLTYTLSPEKPEKVSQLGLSWVQPLYDQAAALNILYSYSNVDSGVVNQVFKIQGKGTIISAKYLQHLLKIGAYKHEWYGGLDYKDFQNVVDFNGNNIGTDVGSAPLSVGYSGHYTASKWSLNFDTRFLTNLELGSNNNTTTYTKTNPNASTSWNALQYNLQWFYAFSRGRMVKLSFFAQQAGQTLIPGEHFSVGGLDNLRGYLSGDASGDSGMRVNLEYYFEPLQEYSLQPLVFYDYASVTINKPQTGELASQSPNSIGGGVRWNYDEHLTAQADLAIALAATTQTKVDTMRLHYSLFYRF